MTSTRIGVTHGKGMVVALRVIERPSRCCAARSTTAAASDRDVRLRRSQRPATTNLTTQPGADYPYRQSRPVFSRRQPAGGRAASRFGSKTGFFPSWTPLLPMGVTLKKNDC